jgi:NADPH:quinone reductase-like Zn-dependent oxidoreductase
MKAFIVERYGDAGAVRAGEMPDPQVGEDDVLVQIHAASVNPLDLKTREGAYKAILPYRVPFILGNDLAGVVVRVGAGVTRFTVGDEVYARPDKDRIGTVAEFIAVHQDDLATKPATLTMDEAASIPLVGLTSWQALVERANLQTGQKILVHAGAGGVGTIAIQLAKHLGQDAREVFAGAEARREAHQHRWPTRSSLRQGAGSESDRRSGDDCVELPNPAAGSAPSRDVLVPVHEGQRGPATRSHRTH